ncbi:hypothetical protein, partial [Pseudomonas vancouverensis]
LMVSLVSQGMMGFPAKLARRKVSTMSPHTRQPCVRSIQAFEKGTRCKSETASGNTRNNGYVLNQPKKQSAQRPLQ